jgi:TPR repeat protein
VAAQWFEKAANAGVTGAMARLGHMYEKGDGVPQSSRTAAKWYVLAANKGNRAARKRMRELGSKPDSTIFKAPDEIDSGLGEIPALSSPSAPVAVAKPVAKPKPKKARKCGGGMLGGLTCAGK